MHETRPRGPWGSSASAVGVRPYDEDPDDWLGEVSDEDWSENAVELAARRHVGPGYEPYRSSDPGVAGRTEDGRPVSARPSGARRQSVERRRLVAGLAVVAVIAVAVLIPALLLRGGGTPAAATGADGDVTTVPVETTTSSTATTPAQGGTSTDAGTSTTPTEDGSATTTTPSTSGTTPSASGTTGFTLPEGTKLKVGEDADPAVVQQLQQALTSAGYDPGAADGTYGEKTAAAVTAFQQDNGLTADGVVGPETASALNSALSG